MNAGIADFLARNDVRMNDAAMARIRAAGAWYRGDATAQHKRMRVDGAEYELLRMGYGKRACADDANLCEVVEVNGGGDNNEQFEAVKALLQANRFDVMYRKQLEKCSAMGTVAAYWRIESADVYDDGTVRGGRLRLNYVDAEGFLPVTVVNDEVLEAAFVGVGKRDGKKVETCVLCTLRDGRYCYHTLICDEEGKTLDEAEMLLGEVKPFAVMRVAAVNNLPNMDGYGLPKLSQAEPVLLGLDQAFTVLMGDIDTADKLVLINEMICGFDVNGEPIRPNEAMKRRFVFMGEKLPEKGTLIHEIVPKIRVDELAKLIELLLSNLSLMFGYGTRRYSFEQGQMTTATQYIGERQDMMQELNRQRFEAREYITGVVQAGLWFENTYHGASWDASAEVLVEFDDSYITDKAQKAATLRADALEGLGGRKAAEQYLMTTYNLVEAEAEDWLADHDGGDVSARFARLLELQANGMMSRAELRAWATGETLDEARAAIAALDTENAARVAASPEISALLASDARGEGDERATL